VPEPIWTEGIKSWDRMEPHATGSQERKDYLRVGELIEANVKWTDKQRDHWKATGETPEQVEAAKKAAAEAAAAEAESEAVPEQPTSRPPSTSEAP